MIITGLTTNTQYFYPQSSMSIGLSTDSMSDFKMKLWGSGGTGTFSFQNGKIFNPETGFIGSYSRDNPFSFSLNYKTGLYSTWVNSNLTSASQSLRDISGYIPTSVTGISFENLSSTNLNLNASLYGGIPDLTFSSLTTSNLIHFTGTVSVAGSPARLYSVDPVNAYQVSVPATGFTLGTYVLSGQNFASGSTINADFNFDFGTVNKDLTVNYSQSLSSLGYITIASYGSVFQSSPVEQYDDYIITSTWNDTSNFQVYIEHMYREGYLLATGTGVGTGVVGGYVTGSGYVNGLVSGYINSGTYATPAGNINATFVPPLLATGTISKLVYATGQLVYSYITMASGIEGILLSVGGGIDVTSGYIVGTVTGTVGPGSGCFVFDQVVYGRPENWAGSRNRGNNRNDGYNSPSANFDSEYEPSYSTYDYSGRVTATGYLYAYATAPATGSFTGGTQLYYYSDTTSLINAFNLFTGDSAKLTGTNAYVQSNYYDFAANGYRGTGVVKKPAIPIGRSIYQIGAKITFDRSSPYGTKDYYKFIVKNEYQTYTITGIGYSL